MSFSSSSSIWRSRLRSVLIFFSTSPTSFTPSDAAGAAPAAAGGREPTVLLLRLPASLPPNGASADAKLSPPSVFPVPSFSGFSILSLSMRLLFFAAVLLIGLASVAGSAPAPGMPPAPSSSLFHLSEYFDCSSGGMYPSRTRTAGRSVPSGRRDCRWPSAMCPPLRYTVGGLGDVAVEGPEALAVAA
eukprot:scaffold26606_cov124-Isochrysis_galbana.AAC.2